MQLGLELNNLRSKVAYDVFKDIIDELHILNKNHMFIGLLDETPDIKPRLPEINRQCWELAFNTAHMDILLKYLAKHTTRNKKYTYAGFKNILFGPDSPFSEERWKHQVEDICYALESRGRITLSKSNTSGRILSIKF
jgi:hypothetical protein